LKAAQFSQAHKDLEESLSIRNELGEKDTVASTKLSIAELSIEEGHAEAAEGLAREARDWFDRAHKNDDRLAASAVLVSALLAGHKNDDAMKELAKTSSAGFRLQNLSVQLALSIAKARAQAASHEAGAAKTILKQALASATKSGYLGDQFECRLLLEEIELKSGKSEASRLPLQQLQKESRDKGFVLIANKAAASL
jgi:hypothetical protein